MAKTFYLQALDENLVYPFEAYFLTLCILSAETVVIFVVRFFDRGKSLVSLGKGSSGILSVKNLTLGLGVVAYIGLAAVKPTSAQTAGTGFFVLFSALAKIFVLGLVMQTRDGAKHFGTNGFITVGLVAAIGFEFIVSLVLNYREGLLSALIGVVLAAYYCRAIRPRHVIVSVLFVSLFGLLISPITLYLRVKKENVPIAEFAELALATTARAIVDPEFLQSLSSYNDSRLKRDNITGYDYYRLQSRSNVLNRLSYVALVDWAYAGMAGRSPLGIRVFEESLQRVTPSFIWQDKKAMNYGIGDFIAWNTGQLPMGNAAFLNYSLAMEGFASYGFAGLVAYPFLFMFPLLFALSRISSFRNISVVSVFFFAIYQHSFVESTTEVILAELTRTIPFFFLILLVLQNFRSTSSIAVSRHG
ncbi:hypothetical protein I6F36_28110 [Bradyrhizobium sp. BRP19]|uniref:hypothetical protein n=1 Tax=Bradyrhizobium sp. BRP19 TaxID=2793823 RepID=UPI001CD484A8|nr:hypothetical protein [Bradyrhizobium sp. BRP19]MCA1550700.1 hypothetical protein [Bradyrhizobium sp. BRP19]